jgi:NADPH-dependent glutamate synthase beta subunit-like oxidoreductase
LLDLLTPIGIPITLKSLLKGIKEAPGKRVLVIGGGNAAADVTVSALRLGAEAAAEAAVRSSIPLGKNAYKIEIIKTLVKRTLAS